WAAGELTGLLAAAATAAGAAVAAVVSARHLPAGRRWQDREVTDPPARRRFFQTTLLTSAFLSADVLIVGALLGSAKLAPYALAGGHLGAGVPALGTRAAAITLGVALVLIPVGTLAIGTAGAALGVLLAEAAGAVPYLRRRARDGWAARDLIPGLRSTPA